MSCMHNVSLEIQKGEITASQRVKNNFGEEVET